MKRTKMERATDNEEASDSESDSWLRCIWDEFSHNATWPDVSFLDYFWKVDGFYYTKIFVL